MADRHDAMETELRNRSAHLDLTATTRRAFLGKLGTAGVGALGLAWATGQADGGGLLPGMGDQFDLRRPHFAPTARRIIYLHMAGSPPHHDLLDPKPGLEKWNGKPCPDELLDPENFAFIKVHESVLYMNKHCKVILSCSDRVSRNFKDLHAFVKSCQKL